MSPSEQIPTPKCKQRQAPFRGFHPSSPESHPVWVGGYGMVLVCVKCPNPALAIPFCLQTTASTNFSPCSLPM